MRLFLAAAALSLALVSAARAEGIVSCSDFKTGWQASMKKLALVSPSASFAAAGEDERVGGITGIEAVLTCRDGALGHLEIAPTGDPKVLDKVVSSVLMGLDKGLTPDKAAAAANALRTESETRKSDAVGSWGPYELSWKLASATARSRFVLDLAEN